MMHFRAVMASLMALFLAGAASGEIPGMAPAEDYWKLRGCVTQAWESGQDVAICHGMFSAECFDEAPSRSDYVQFVCLSMEHTAWDSLARALRRDGLRPEPEPEGVETLDQMLGRKIRVEGQEPIILPGQTETSEVICAKEHPDDPFAKLECETEHRIALTRHWINEMGGLPERGEE